MMETDSNIVHMTLPVLIILLGITVVLFALVMDYLERNVRWLEKEKIEHEKSEEISKTRIVSVFFGIFQLIIFFASSDVRQNHFIWGNFVFVVSVFMQSWFQGLAERRIMGRQLQVEELRRRVFSGFRALIWISFGVFSYITIVFGSMALALVASKSLELGSTFRAILVLAGAIVGLLSGLGLNFAIAPIHLKNILPNTALSGNWLELVQKHFVQQRVTLPHFYVLEKAMGAESSTVFISGFRSGRGWFRPALFISRKILEKLTSKELDAVILHEISHIHLSHLKRRLMFSSSLIVGTVFLGILMILLSQILFPGPQGAAAKELLSPLVALISFVIAFRLIGQQAHQHELEADWYAIQKLGSSFEHFSSAIRKLDEMNGVSTLSDGLGHPSTERRIFLLAAKIELHKDLRPTKEFEQNKAA